MFWDASFNLDKANTLFYFATNRCNSSGSAGNVLAEFCAHRGEGQQAERRPERRGVGSHGERASEEAAGCAQPEKASLVLVPWDFLKLQTNRQCVKHTRSIL